MTFGELDKQIQAMKQVSNRKKWWQFWKHHDKHLDILMNSHLYLGSSEGGWTIEYFFRECLWPSVYMDDSFDKPRKALHMFLVANREPIPDISGHDQWWYAPIHFGTEWWKDIENTKICV